MNIIAKLPHEVNIFVLKVKNVTCPSGEPCAPEGIIICGCSFGICFLLRMKDCAGLRLIWRGEDGKVHNTATMF